MAIAPQRLGIGIRRYFTTEDRHPYDEVLWDRRDARISNFRDGSVAFEQLDVEVPSTWSFNATNILALDAGTTGVRAVAFDDQLAVVAEHYRELPQ